MLQYNVFFFFFFNDVLVKTSLFNFFRHIRVGYVRFGSYSTTSLLHASFWIRGWSQGDYFWVSIESLVTTYGDYFFHFKNSLWGLIFLCQKLPEGSFQNSLLVSIETTLEYKMVRISFSLPVTMVSTIVRALVRSLEISMEIS